MAEAIAVSLSGKLAAALSHTAILRLSSLVGVRSDIAATIRHLELVRAFLRVADSRHGTDALADAWVSQVREVAFELEDVADECSFLSGRRFVRDCVNVMAWVALSRRLRKARDRLSLVFAAKGEYGIRLADGATPATPASGVAAAVQISESARFLEEEEIVGFAAHRKLLMGWLAENAEPRRLTVVALCGMGGVGKTTLVTSMYKEVVKSHFECAAWVAVSQGFNMNDLLKKINKELHLDVTGTDYLSLVTPLREHLSKKRYLVVLDDVWDASLWDKLRRAVFRDDATGSRVVVTTRSSDVARAAAPERIMMLQPLPWRDAWTLFCSVAFRQVSGRTCPSHLEELAVNLLERCRGLPLAIVSVGNLLAFKDRTEFAWRNVRDCLVWDNRSSDLGIGEAASILNLSIDDLPEHLKKCFLSCSIYPEDFLIKRKILIRNWVAQGFVDETQEQLTQGQRTMEDVADYYLDQLVQRSLMQVIERNEFGRAKRCVIHDLIRELITHRSREEGFIQFAKCNITLSSNIRIHHLAVDKCEMDHQSIPKMASLRSFHSFRSELDASHLSRFRLLTVLNLWCTKIDKLPNSVTNLRNLRYLGIRSTLVKELPKDLGKLHKLQTLDAKLSMVQRLPSSIAKLKDLRHLILLRRHAANLWDPFPGMAVGLPEGLQNLTNLQTLKRVQADAKIVKSLAKLEQMRSLELSAVDTSLTVDLSSSISRMSCLMRLEVIRRDADAVLDLEAITRPPLKLQKLSLTGRLARRKLPSWTSSLTSLMQLRLCECSIAQDSLVLLASLPSLVNLSLVGAYHESNMTFAGGSFPALRKLSLEELPNLNRIEFQKGCLENLRDLVLGMCTVLTETPHGMENLVHLQNLELFGMPTEFLHKLEEEKGGAGYYMPANPRFLEAPGPSRYLRRHVVPRRKVQQRRALPPLLV